MNANRRNRHAADLAARSGSWWRPRLFLGVVLFLGTVGLLFAYVAPSDRSGLRQAPGEPGTAASPEAPRNALAAHAPEVPADSGTLSLGSTAPATYLSRRSPERVEELYDAALGGWITGADAAGIDQVLRELRDQGTGAVPAIREFLERMEDVGFGGASGDGDPLASGSLRLALFDILGEIGGSEAIEAVLAQLGQTGDPLEIAILARNLESLAPGTYRPEVLRAASEALRWAADAPRAERPDVGPVFELLQAYGGAEVVRDVARETGHWWEYSLMALAGLPEGEGVPVLIAEANHPTLSLEHKTQFPIQMLAQAATQSAEARGALVDLARSGAIPDGAWEMIAGALAGKHLQFPLQLFEGTALGGDRAVGAGAEAPELRHYYIEYRNMRYNQRLTSANWSYEQIDQQLALIDHLRHASSSPAAWSALDEAEALLRGGSS